MRSRLATFLQAKEPLFDQALQELEKRTGKKGIDAALAGEIAQKAGSVISDLGLDAGCSGPDLYKALVERVKRQDEHLAHTIGGHDPEDVHEMIPLVVRRIEQVQMPRDGWFIKTEVAEGMLKSMPPKAVMKRLGHDSLEGLLEKEDLFEIYGSLRFAEEADWLNKFNAKYSKLKPADFEARNIRIVQFDPNKWGDIAEHFIQKKLHNITNLKELGAICVMPMTIERMPGVTLKVMPLIFHYFNEIRLYSAFFKLMQPKKNFGQIVAETLIADTPDIPLIDHGHIHWRVIQRYFGKLKNESHPEIFEPHVQPEDLHWRKAENLLYQVDPDLAMWRDMDYVATLKTGETVTFNLMDVSLSYSNGLKFEDRYLYHFRESLWNEVFARYFGQKELEEQLLMKLDNAMIKPETL
ncbi:MAG TPA: hypothetical protein VLF21_03455 [Candidatus Saccharimonadales bacterium]|nr:hypothetical protein [Candidatus Saccharimonadales bacterium]